MREGCAVHAYVLMTNHVHLLVTPMAEGAINRVMQSLGRRYVRYINDRYCRTGTLWEGRYKACLVENGGHLMWRHRYIELNPRMRRNATGKGISDPSSWRMHAFNSSHITVKTLIHQRKTWGSLKL